MKNASFAVIKDDKSMARTIWPHPGMFCSILISLFFAAPITLADDAKWTTVSETAQHIFDLRNGSLQITQTRDNTPIAVLIIRMTEIRSKQISVEKNYVSLQDCQNQQGKLVTLDIDGSYLYENSFVFDAGNSASTIAKIICMAAQARLQETYNKGI